MFEPKATASHLDSTPRHADPFERCPLLGDSKKHLLAASISEFDPLRTLVTTRLISFDRPQRLPSVGFRELQCHIPVARRQVASARIGASECTQSFICCIRLHFRRRVARYAASRGPARTRSEHRLKGRGEATEPGLIATLAALVICLLIASAQSSFQTQSNQIKQKTANIILIDNLLARSGPQAQPLRPLLRSGVKILVERIWREQNPTAAKVVPFEASAQSDLFFDKLLELTTENDGQRAMQTPAIQSWIDLAQTRVLFAQTDSAIPMPFLAVLVFWLAAIFVSFGLFARPNPSLPTRKIDVYNRS